jgi:hypothetical protein
MQQLTDVSTGINDETTQDAMRDLFRARNALRVEVCQR